MKNKKIIIYSLGAILLLASIVIGKSIYERSSTQADASSKAIRLQPNTRGESVNVFAGQSENVSAASDTADPQTPAKTKTDQLKPQSPAVPSPDSMSATVIAGEAAAALFFADGDTFYDALIGARNEDKLQFSGKNYTGLGFLVTEIGSLRSGGGKYLLYYINGKEATVGVSAYALKDGDIIEWKLE